MVNISDWTLGKNKPKQSQFKANMPAFGRKPEARRMENVELRMKNGKSGVSPSGAI